MVHICVYFYSIAPDAEGVRRSKTASEGEEKKEILFISDTSGELSRTLAETDEEGELLASYGWGDTLISQTREGKTSTYLYDGQGNVRGLLNEKGNLTDTYAYNAYGELTEKTGETENHYLYTGEYYDGVSGLYYLRARYMSPETGTFISMDTWQGDLYEPVTLHKYLYANANPVKYKDPSGMFSLPECNIASAIGAELYQNQNVILGMSLLNGIGKSVMTRLCGGDAGDMTEAFLEGMIEGAAMGMLFCAAAAVVATSMLTVMMAHTAASSVVSIVLAIYSVSEGDYLNALVYGAVAVAGIIGVCRWWKVSYNISVTGEKGNVFFNNDTTIKGESSSTLKMDLQFFSKKDLRQVSDAAREIGVDRIEFGNYIHEVKADLGMKANENFSYQELLELAKELLSCGGN